MQDIASSVIPMPAIETVTVPYKGLNFLRPEILLDFISVTEEKCKHTRFSSTHFLRVPGFQPSAGTLLASGYSGIHGAARCYIPSASAR